MSDGRNRSRSGRGYVSDLLSGRVASGSRTDWFRGRTVGPAENELGADDSEMCCCSLLDGLVLLAPDSLAGRVPRLGSVQIRLN